MATTTADSCGCGTNANGTPSGSLTGRTPQQYPANFWPDHDMSPRTDFINERNRTAVMWRL